MKYCPQCRSELTLKEIGGVQRKVCSSSQCDFVIWNNPVPVVAALVRRDGDIIIARNASWPENIYSLISGYLEENETPEESVVREVKEELDLNVLDSGFIGHYYFKEKNQLIIAFWVNAVGEIRLNEELVDFKRLSLEELKDYDFEPLYITKSIIGDWINWVG